MALVDSHSVPKSSRFSEHDGMLLNSTHWSLKLRPGDEHPRERRPAAVWRGQLSEVRLSLKVEPRTGPEQEPGTWSEPGENLNLVETEDWMESSWTETVQDKHINIIDIYQFTCLKTVIDP